jgi:hypothetical protein
MSQFTTMSAALERAGLIPSRTPEANVARLSRRIVSLMIAYRAVGRFLDAADQRVSARTWEEHFEKYGRLGRQLDGLLSKRAQMVEA